MSPFAELATAEQYRQHHNTFYEAVVTKVTNESINVAIETASGELAITALPVYGRDIANVAVNEPCLVILPNGMPELGVVFMRTPDTRIQLLMDELANLQTRISALEQQYNYLLNSQV